MEHRSQKIAVSDALLVALSLLLAVGAASFLAPCAHADGSFAACHWAGKALSAVGWTLSALALARLFVGAGLKQGADMAFIAFGILTALLPGPVIQLCGMAGMRCRMVTRPGALVLGALIAVTAAADLLARNRRA